MAQHSDRQSHHATQQEGNGQHIHQQNALSTFRGGLISSSSGGDLPDGLSASLQPLNVSTFLYDNQNNHHHHHHLHHPMSALNAGKPS